MAQQSAAIALLLLREWSMTFPLGTWHDERDAYQAAYFRQLLEHVDGNIVRAAEIAGLSRNASMVIIKRHGLQDFAEALREGL